VVRKVATVVVSVGRECASEVLLQDVRGDNFLALLVLGACLGVVLAKEGIVGCDESNDALLALVAHINTDEHGLG